MKQLPPLDPLSVSELEALVGHHNQRYWDEAAPEISDHDYDRLVEALRRRAPDSPALQALGPARLGAEVRHRVPMLSLDKAYERQGILDFIETPKTKKRKVFGSLMVTPKIDGVACSLVYGDRGDLTLAATRGDGRRGEEITANVRRIGEIPQRIAPPALEVRGELYMTRSRFQKRYASDFVNARNLTAGAIKHKDPARCEAYGLSFFAYDLIGASVGTELEKLERLNEMGFATLPWSQAESDDREAVWQRIQEMGERARELDCETDGVVIKVCDLAEQERLGITEHHPSYAIAFKFQGETGTSTLLRVEWSVSRTGRITPVAEVDPVFLSGANVARASLHNLEIYEQLGITQGCVVELTRRGEVIPQIERVVQPGSTPILPPTRCPSCAAAVERRDKFLYCTTPDVCPDALVSTLKHFCRTLDIEGFGAKHLETLVRSGAVKRPTDFFNLTKERLLELRESPSAGGELRIADKLAQKLIDAIQSHRRISPETFLAALGIEDLGPKLASDLMAHFGTLDAVRGASVEQIAAVPGFAQERARSVVEGLGRMSSRIDDLLSFIELEAAPETVPQTTHPLSGKSAVFTGKMATMDRKKAQGRVRDLGGTTPATVTKELDYLVIGDDGSPLLGDGRKSTKHRNAERHIEKGAQIQIVSEAAFLRLLES